MTDREEERAARIARMAAAPTKAQILAELDFEISDALHLSTTANLPSMVRWLRMAKLEVTRLRQRPEYKD